MRHAKPLAPAVTAVEEVSRPDGFDCINRDAIECLDFGCEGHALAHSRHVERFNSKRIACGNDTILRSKDKCEHAIQILDPACPPRPEQMHDRFAIGRGLKVSLSEDRAKIRVIVDFAIGHKHVVGMTDWLRTILRADDRQATMCHRDGSAGKRRHMHFVGAAMADLRDHLLGQAGIASIPEAYETTHFPVSLLITDMDEPPNGRFG